ncbi:MAG: hypothetical protein RET84_23795 [Pseudomonadota bacterium]|nr:hypothetical protein [Pseudomonadota bacterium]
MSLSSCVFDARWRGTGLSHDLDLGSHLLARHARDLAFKADAMLAMARVF